MYLSPYQYPEIQHLKKEEIKEILQKFGTNSKASSWLSAITASLTTFLGLTIWHIVIAESYYMTFIHFLLYVFLIFGGSGLIVGTAVYLIFVNTKLHKYIKDYVK